MPISSTKVKKAVRAAGIAFCCYGAGVLLTLGPGYWFNWFFLAAGAVLLGVHACWERIFPLRGILPVTAAVLILVLFLCFLVFETVMLTFPLRPAAVGADYLLLLGCQVRGTVPSRDYAARLRGALSYLQENPRTKVIACGGMGDTESLSEADAAFLWLTRKGIDPARILREDRSTSTLENLSYALEIIEADGGDPSDDRFVIVTSAYHQFRAYRTARSLGYENVSCTGRNGIVFLLPHYFCREFAAYVKFLLAA